MIRSYQSSDYYILCEWWNKQNWQAPDRNMLPKTGLIIENICAGFLYKTDSDVALLEFIIANPESNKEERSEALDLLINNLVNIAKESGYKAIFTSLQHTKLLERYKKHGFIETDKSMTNMIKRI